MEKFYKLLILILLSVFLPLTVSAGSLRPIKAGIYENEPKIFTKNGIPSGFWVELLQYIASKENWDIIWVHGTWDESLRRLEKGKIDIMPDVAYTKQRAEKYKFQNETVFISWARIYVQEGSKIQSIPDLSGKKIAVLKSSVNYKGPDGIADLAEKFGIDCIFIETTDYNSIFELIEEEKVDAGVVNKNFGNHKEKKYKIKRTGIVFQPADLRFAFSKKSAISPILITRIDYNLEQLKRNENSIYYDLMERYFEWSINEKAVMPEWAKKVLFIITGALLFLIMVSVASRFQIKRKTTQLQESEERYRTLFENTAEGILVADIKTKRFLYANPAICRILGYTKEELSKMKIPDIHPKDVLEKITADFEARTRNEKNLASSIPFLGKDGRIIYTDIVTSKIDIEGKECMVGFFTDISERKKAEEEKEKINLQLLQAQKMESVGRLAGTIAHDFNNLLTAIIGYGHLLYDEMAPNDPKRVTMEEILRAAKQAAGLTGQLLAFSRKTPIKLEVLELNSIVNEIEDMVDRLTGEDITFTKILTEDQINIKSDSTQLEQIVLNLIVNARDAIPKVGKITVKTEKVNISEKESKKIPYSQPGEFACLSIEDTGVGMDKKTISKIFDPFFTTKKTGTGLGLSVVQEIVNKLYGWINVESKKGRGTIFRIYLPLCYEKKTIKDKKIIPLSGLQGKGETILVIEDEKITRKFIVKVLEENGYKVLETNSIEEATDSFKRNKNKVKMIFTDIVLSDGSGLEFAEKIISENGKIKILLSSGYTDEKAELSHIAGKNFDFLEKPYEVLDLLKKVKEILD